MRTLPTFGSAIRDFRHACRQLARTKGFTAGAALTLALGIGASTAVFAVLDAVVLRPLPFVEPDRLMAVRSADARGVPHQLSYPDFFDYRKQNRAFERFVSYRDADFTLTGSQQPGTPRLIVMRRTTSTHWGSNSIPQHSRPLYLRPTKRNRRKCCGPACTPAFPPLTQPTFAMQNRAMPEYAVRRG